MKTLLCTLIFATLTTVAARADSILIVFDQPDQAALPGQTLQFFGTITNTTNATVFLNSDDLNLGGFPDLSTTDQFLATVPISLAPSGQAGDSSGLIELFDVTVADPLSNPLGTYPGTYDLVGGVDGNAADILGTASFSVTTTPEPSSIYLLLSAALLIAILIPKPAHANRAR